MAKSQALRNVFKLHDVVNVKDPTFGAKGDGTGDDTAAIQAVIDSISTGVIVVPRGTYNIVAGLTMGQRKSIVGEGQQATIFSFTPTEITRRASG